MCLGFKPLTLIDVAMSIVSTQEEYSHARVDANKAIRFVERIQRIHQKSHDILEKANTKYKKWHYKHRVPHKFQVGDKDWLHL